MENDARAALAGWDAERPTNHHDSTPNLALAMRTRQLGELVRVLQATWLLAEASADTESEKANVAAFFVRRRVSRGYDPEADGGHTHLIDRVLADDVLAPASADVR